MAFKRFYLLGDDLSAGKEIDVPSSIDDDGLRNLIASHFAIVQPKGTQRKLLFV